MSTIKNVSAQALPLPDGRLVAPGRHAERVDLDDHEVARHVRDGRAIDVDADQAPDTAAPAEDRAPLVEADGDSQEGALATTRDDLPQTTPRPRQTRRVSGKEDTQ